jgi:zeta-carotene desaturase
LSETQKTLSIVGGGLAGIAAAEAASTQGYQVALFERSGVLGGRVASLFEPTQQQWIDIGQHLILGCCTEILALHKRLDIDQFFKRSDNIPFATPPKQNGKQQHWSLAPSSFLPKRWQLLPSFFAIPLLPIMERIKTGILLRKLNKEMLPDITVAEWFKQHNVSQNALDAFWLPLILSSLSEIPDYVAVKAVQKVIRDGFLAGKEGMSIYLMTIPLRAIYHDAISAAFSKRDVSLHFFKRLQRLHWKKKKH